MFSINRHRKHTGTTARKGRRGRVLAATVLAGALAAGLVGIAGPANASTILNPNCPVPSNVAFQFVRMVNGSGSPLRGPILTSSVWQTTYNGVHYTGATTAYGIVGSADTIAPNQVPGGHGIVNGVDVISAACQAG